MTKGVLLSLLLIPGFCSTLPAQVSGNFPSFTEVVRTYFTQYEEEYSNLSMIRFQKKKEGWFMVLEENPTTHVISYQAQFWSASERKYLPVKGKPLTYDVTSLSVDNRVHDYYYAIGYYPEMLADYQQFPYFGYEGWDQDVIKDLAPQSGLNDTLTEAVARAYIIHATAIIRSTPGLPLDRTRKDSFVDYEKKALERYDRLRRRYPGYRSHIGNDMGTECANQRVSAYAELLWHGDSAEAKRFLRRVDYPDTLIARVRHLLAAAEKGSIFCADGDNDFFASLYLQKSRHYREDIAVIDYSLLLLVDYRLYLCERYKKEPLFSSSAAGVRLKNFDYAWRLNYSDDSISLAGLLASVKINSDSIRTYTAGHVLIPFHEKDGSGATTLCLGLPNYILSPDFMLLDMYNTAAGKRNIYFADRLNEKSDPMYYIIFGKHLRACGPLFCLSPN